MKYKTKQLRQLGIERPDHQFIAMGIGIAKVRVNLPRRFAIRRDLDGPTVLSFRSQNNNIDSGTVEFLYD